MPNLSLDIQINAKSLSEDQLLAIATTLRDHIETEACETWSLGLSAEESVQFDDPNDPRFRINFVEVSHYTDLPLPILFRIVDQCRSAMESRRDTNTPDDDYPIPELHDFLKEDTNGYLKQLAIYLYNE